MKNHKLKVVIAGNYQQYSDYISSQNYITDTIYVNSECELRGLQNVEIIKVGEWWKNPIAYSPFLRMLEEKVK